MSESRKPLAIEIDQRYMNIVKNPDQRSAALDLAVQATVPLWEMAGIDVKAQLTKQAGINNKIVDAYTVAQRSGDDIEASTHEAHLAYILQIADGFYGDKLDIVEEVSPKPAPTEKIFAYSTDD